jgi:hypothetical protein
MGLGCLEVECGSSSFRLLENSLLKVDVALEESNEGLDGFGYGYAICFTNFVDFCFEDGS